MSIDKGLKSANIYIYIYIYIKSTGEKRTGKVFRAGGEEKRLLFFSSMVAKDNGNNCRLFLCKSHGERREEEWTLTISITGKQKALSF